MEEFFTSLAFQSFNELSFENNDNETNIDIDEIPTYKPIVTEKKYRKISGTKIKQFNKEHNCTICLTSLKITYGNLNYYHASCNNKSNKDCKENACSNCNGSLEIIMFDCGHSLHKDCAYYHMDNSNKCPNCRKLIKKIYNVTHVSDKDIDELHKIANQSLTIVMNDIITELRRNSLK